MVSKSNPQFIRVLASHEYETITFPREILYNPDLSPEAMKLLLILLDYGKRPNWQLRQNHLISISNYNYYTFNKAMKNLESAGYVQRTRTRIEGKLGSYDYKFSAFPIFLDKEDKNPLHKESEPVSIFKTRNSRVENRDYTSSINSNVLEETTNKEDLVSSSFDKLKELEEVSNISESQKATLYKKFSHEKIISALKAVDLSKADCPFAVIITAIRRNFQPAKEKRAVNTEAYAVYHQAESFLRKGCYKIKLEIDNEKAYIYLGTSVRSYSLNDPEFKKKFSEGINTLIK